jgi:hypothetical protein
LLLKSAFDTQYKCSPLYKQQPSQQPFLLLAMAIYSQKAILKIKSAKINCL